MIFFIIILLCKKLAQIIFKTLCLMNSFEMSLTSEQLRLLIYKHNNWCYSGFFIVFDMKLPLG